MVFVGPELPGAEEEGSLAEEPVPCGAGSLSVHSFDCRYDQFLTLDDDEAPGSVKKADCIFGFDLGLVSPLYDWTASLLAIQEASVDRFGNTCEVPFVTCCNSAADAEAEQAILQRARYGFPAGAAAVQNPFRCLRMCQSDSLANDVYCKNS